MGWQEFAARHRVGDVVDGVVTQRLPFGSFVEAEGCTGLAPQRSWPVGTRVRARIVEIDSVQQRFSLAAA